MTLFRGLNYCNNKGEISVGQGVERSRGESPEPMEMYDKAKK